jgi:hypothetical protein
MTSPEWLFNELKKDILGLEYRHLYIFEQAKEMHKAETISFTEKFIEDYTSGDYAGYVYLDKEISEAYQETFGSKGSGVLTDGSGAVRDIGGAVELPQQKTLYTEEQVEEKLRKAIDMASKELGHGAYYQYKEEEIIQSLKQSKK